MHASSFVNKSAWSRFVVVVGERDRQTETETLKETVRQTDREADRDRDFDRDRETDRDSGGERQTDRQTDRQSGGERESLSSTLIYMAGRQTQLYMKASNSELAKPEATWIYVSSFVLYIYMGET